MPAMRAAKARKLPKPSGYTHVSALEAKLIRNMKREGLTWPEIMRITERGRGAIAAALRKKPIKGTGVRRPKIGRPAVIRTNCARQIGIEDTFFP